MATISGGSPRREPESGAMSPRMPYDRPGFLSSALHNPNWISRNIFPPTRAIVTGAGRMLASVLGFESSSSSSSSECSSYDSHDNNDDQEVSSQGVHAIEDHVHILHTIDENDYLRGCLSCSFVGHQREPQSFAGKHKAKHLIEQLLKHESFSRQECDKLTDIIKSRVVDSPSICGLGLRTLDETPERTDVEIHDFRNKAVLEAATKLLEEKKSGPDYMSELPRGTSALNSVTLKHQDVEGEVGSPMDLPKSYMQTCPPWASPSKNNIDFRFPSSIAMPLFKEEPPYSIGGNFLYSSKRKRNSLATGSWNIQDEIRRVRYKASEEMLRNLSSSKNGWSSFPLEYKKVPDSIATNNLGPAKENKSQGSKRLVDASVDLAAKSASQVTKDVFHVDALPRPASLCSKQNLVMQTIPSIKVEKDETLDVGRRLRPTVYIKTEAHSDVDDTDVNHLKEPNGSIQPFSHSNKDSQVEDKNHWTLNEVAAEEKRVHLYEASAVVPTVNETDAAASGSQHSWNMQHEGSPEDQNTPTSKASSAGKSHFSIEQQQQQGEKANRYNMRNGGRHR